MANVKLKKSKELLKNSPEVKIILIPAKKIANLSIQKEIQELVAHMVMMGEKKGRPVKHDEEESYAA